MRPVTMSRSFEIRTEVAVVVDFAVISDREIVVFVEHRLAAAADIDNAEPAMPQGGKGVDEVSITVRSSMSKRGGHLMHGRFPNGIGSETEVSGYPAHIRLPEPPRSSVSCSGFVAGRYVGEKAKRPA